MLQRAAPIVQHLSTRAGAAIDLHENRRFLALGAFRFQQFVMQDRAVRCLDGPEFSADMRCHERRIGMRTFDAVFLDPAFPLAIGVGKETLIGLDRVGPRHDHFRCIAVHRCRMPPVGLAKCRNRATVQGDAVNILFDRRFAVARERHLAACPVEADHGADIPVAARQLRPFARIEAIQV